MTADDFRDDIMVKIEAAVDAWLSLEQMFGVMCMALHRVQVALDVELVRGVAALTRAEP